MYLTARTPLGAKNPLWDVAALLCRDMHYTAYPYIEIKGCLTTPKGLLVLYVLRNKQGFNY